MKPKLSIKPSFSVPFFLAVLCILCFYVMSHIWNLWLFPVFADESIYIRWAQLFLDDWKQYLFFPLNDGKTPLFVWMLAAAQRLNSDQLVAGRFVSVVGGFFQVLLIWQILKQFKARPATQLFGMIMVAVLPFWFMYHRLAVMDGWLTVWLSLSFLASIKAVANTGTRRWLWVTISGLSFGAALWTKLPALFYLPVFLLFPLFAERLQIFKSEKISLRLVVKSWWPQLMAAAIGVGVFAAMRVSPAFGQLFARGQDFSFSIGEIMSGKWTEVFPNSLRFLTYFGTYLTWPILVLAASGVFSNQARRKVGLLLLCTFVFLCPFILLGKVVHPRYLLPAALFITVAAVLSLESLYFRVTQAIKDGKVLGAAAGVVIAILAGQVFTNAAYFMATMVYSPDNTPFVAVDRKQYLEDWSSGHGIVETVGLIRGLSQAHTVAVATEGRFGTLPDGLLLYFHGQNVDRIYIEGTGQYPVKTIPDFFSNRAKEFDQSLLVVNSDRMEFPLPDQNLVAEFCRPNNAACLQVWDITGLVKAVPDNQSL